MYSYEERNMYFVKTLEKLEALFADSLKQSSNITVDNNNLKRFLDTSLVFEN